MVLAASFSKIKYSMAAKPLAFADKEIISLSEIGVEVAKNSSILLSLASQLYIDK